MMWKKKGIVKRMKRPFLKVLNFCFSVVPVKKSRVFFISFYGKSYSDNPKAISIALYEKYGSQFEHIWVIDHPVDLPPYIKTCRYKSIKMLYYLCTSKIWVSNFCMSKGTYKKKSQFYIQTWHGDRGFKYILNDVPGKHDYIYETAHADLMTCGSDFGEKYYYRGGFRYQGEIAKIGCPRNDIFFKETSVLQDEIREKYHLASTDHIVMFAPTYREKYKKEEQQVTFDFSKVIRILTEVTHEQWKILVRSHISNSKCGFSLDYNDNIISVTDYPDMNELLQITDILISDYSSAIGDFALSGRMCLLYQDDVEEYTKGDRGLIFNITKSPFLRCSTPDELYDLLSNYNNIDIQANCKAINRFYGSFEDGTASKKMSDIIYNRVYAQ